MIWLGMAFNWLRGLPWQLWAAAGLAVLVLALRWHWIGVGEGRVQAAWDAAVAAQQAEADRQQREADKAAQDAARAAQEAVATTREETGHAAESVRTIIRDRIVHVSPDCRDAVALPDSVQAQGREAVARARSALRAAPDGRNP